MNDVKKNDRERYINFCINLGVTPDEYEKYWEEVNGFKCNSFCVDTSITAGGIQIQYENQEFGYRVGK